MSTGTQMNDILREFGAFWEILLNRAREPSSRIAMSALVLRTTPFIAAGQICHVSMEAQISSFLSTSFFLIQ